MPLDVAWPTCGEGRALSAPRPPLRAARPVHQAGLCGVGPARACCSPWVGCSARRLVAVGAAAVGVPHMRRGGGFGRRSIDGTQEAAEPMWLAGAAPSWRPLRLPFHMIVLCAFKALARTGEGPSVLFRKPPQSAWGGQCCSFAGNASFGLCPTCSGRQRLRSDNCRTD